MTTAPTPSTHTITHPTTGITEPAIMVPASRLGQLIELLDHCDEFLCTSSRVVRGELADYCLARPHLTSGWLIERIGFAALQLRTDLEEAGQPKPPRPRPARPRAQW